MFHPLSESKLIEGTVRSACPVCHGVDLKRIGRLPEAFHFCSFQYRHPINRGALVECHSCGLHFRNPCLSRETLDDLYRRQPATVWGSTAGGRQDVPLIAALIKGLQPRPIDILDVGCYTGALLVELRRILTPQRELHCHGVEPSEKAAAEAEKQGIKILGASIEELDPATQKFDVILLTDVFEHILEVDLFLESLCRFLRPSGQLVIMTGASDSEPFLRYRNTYHYCATPEHLVFISKRHAEWLANRLGTGLMQYSIISHVFPRPSRLKGFLKSLAYWALRKIPATWLGVENALVHRIAWLRGLGVQNFSGKPDHAFVVFRAPGT